MGARREIRTAVSVPALKPPGGRAWAQAYGGLRGSCGRLAVAVGGAQRARPPAGQGGAVCGARVLGAAQRVAVAVRGGPTMKNWQKHEGIGRQLGPPRKRSVLSWGEDEYPHDYFLPPFILGWLSALQDG